MKFNLFFTVLFLSTACTVFAQSTPAPALPGGLDVMADLAQPKAFKALRESSAQKDLAKNGDSLSVEPGQTLVLGELEGPGAITHFWIFGFPMDPFLSNALVVRMYWDDAEQPSVEAPLGDFFGVGQGMSRNVDSMVV